ncbi:DUF2569 family protein [Amorphus sp. MBR-141]
MTNWKQLSEVDAKAHRLYGVKGWLLVILILMALGALNSLVTLFTYSEMRALYGAYAPVSTILSIVFGLIYALIALAGFLKDSRFPAYVSQMLYVTMVVAVINSVVAGVLAPVQAGKMSAIVGGLIGLVQGGLLIWYFKASKRVNVTYFHRVRADE